MTASSASRSLFAADALLPTGWARHVLLRWDEGGQLSEVRSGVDEASLQSSGADAVRRVVGPLIPGMPNLHSHAFQRAFGGLTEFRGRRKTAFGAGAT